MIDAGVTGIFYFAAVIDFNPLPAADVCARLSRNPHHVFLRWGLGFSQVEVERGRLGRTGAGVQN